MLDLTVRDWMVIVGVLLILAVLLDAWRRVYLDRRAPLRMKLSEGEVESEEELPDRKDVDLAWLKELPNGGARVVKREHRAVEQDQDAQAEELQGDSEQHADTQPQINSQQDAPSRESRSTIAGRRVLPSGHAQRSAPVQPEPAEAAPAGDDEPELLSGMSTNDEPENLDWLDALESEQRREPAASESRVTARLPRDVEPEVFMLNVVARNPAGFRGEDILHILLACDLRFGDMSFFHRHEHEAGRGAIQFSVANMMQPGVFDIDNMSDFSTPGLVFFVTMPGPEDMMKAFDYMLETAQAVARNLEGDVLDESRSALTRQTVEHSRQQIRDLERRLLAPRLAE